MVIPMDPAERAQWRAARVDKGPDHAVLARELAAIEYLRGAGASVTTVCERWGLSRQDAVELAREVAAGDWDC